MSSNRQMMTEGRIRTSLSRKKETLSAFKRFSEDHGLQVFGRVIVGIFDVQLEFVYIEA